LPSVPTNRKNSSEQRPATPDPSDSERERAGSRTSAASIHALNQRQRVIGDRSYIHHMNDTRRETTNQAEQRQPAICLANLMLLLARGSSSGQSTAADTPGLSGGLTASRGNEKRGNKSGTTLNMLIARPLWKLIHEADEVWISVYGAH
jgi:hypothetical protein